MLSKEGNTDYARRSALFKYVSQYRHHLTDN